MSTPVLWIVFPLILAIGLWFLRSYQWLVVMAATLVCLGLALAAWIFPFEGLLTLGSFSWEITPVLSVLGRRFVLLEGDRYLLIFIYSIGAFWFFAEGLLRKHLGFIPLGLAIISLSIAALAVDPFFYAALIIEIIVLISIPMLLPPGAKVGQGILRYLIFQTIAMTLILLAGWAAGGVNANPNDSELTIQALVFLGLGFIFWLAIFPFHTWIPLLISEVHPYRAGFLLVFLPQVILLLALDFLNAFGWLRNFSELADILRLAGVLMVTAGGVWSAFQRNLARMMGFFIIVEIGFSLLALSLRTETGYGIYVSMLLPRTIIIALWSLALSKMDVEAFDLTHMAGVLRKKPVESLALLTASFSISGLPLLAIFPLRQVLLENLAQQSIYAVVWSLVGMTGLMAGSVRTLQALITQPDSASDRQSDWRVIILLLIGIVVLIMIGLLPKLFLSWLTDLLHAFGNLV